MKKLNLYNFFEGKRELDLIKKYQSKHPYIIPDTIPFLFIAHAGGGLIKKTYLNNWEAIRNSYSKNIKFIEIDLHYTIDSVVVLSHDFVNKNAAEFLKDTTSGSHLTLNDLLEWLNKKDVFLITDIKANNLRILGDITTSYPDLLDHIIPQAYTIPEIAQIKEMGYQHVIFTNYISRYPNHIIQQLAGLKLLFAITLPYDINFRLMQNRKAFLAFQTPVLTHTINDIDIVRKIKESGARGVYTDFLLIDEN